MSAAPWPIAEIEIIGGHCCPRPPAPFGRGPAVVRRLDDPNSIRVAFTLNARYASGDPLTPSQWRDLLDSFNAVALPEPVPAAPHTALWVFTAAFGPTLGACVKQLRERNVLIAQPPGSPTLQLAVSDKDNQGPTLALVDELHAHPFRLQWRNLAHDDAWKHLQRGDLDDAQRHAERALSLLPEPSAEDLALLSLIYSRNDRLTRSSALRTMAGNTHGAKFVEQFDAEFERLHKRLPAMTPARAEQASMISTASFPRNRLKLLKSSNERS